LLTLNSMTHSIFDSFDSVVLRAAIAYRYCTIKSHKEKDDVGSTNSRRGYSMSLLRHIGTNCARNHPHIPVFTMLQDNMMHLSKLLLTSCQFSSVRIPIEYGGHVMPCSISSFITAGLWRRSG